MNDHTLIFPFLFFLFPSCIQNWATSKKLNFFSERMNIKKFLRGRFILKYFIYKYQSRKYNLNLIHTYYEKGFQLIQEGKPKEAKELYLKSLEEAKKENDFKNITKLYQ